MRFPKSQRGATVYERIGEKKIQAKTILTIWKH